VGQWKYNPFTRNLDRVNESVNQIGYAFELDSLYNLNPVRKLPSMIIYGLFGDDSTGNINALVSPTTPDIYFDTDDNGDYMAKVI
jgi:hypothetical protein